VPFSLGYSLSSNVLLQPIWTSPTCLCSPYYRYSVFFRHTACCSLVGFVGDQRPAIPPYSVGFAVAETIYNLRKPQYFRYLHQYHHHPERYQCALLKPHIWTAGQQYQSRKQQFSGRQTLQETPYPSNLSQPIHKCPQQFYSVDLSI
jgi:hypothetical protein